MTGRRPFLPVNTLQGSPTLETMQRREPSRRYFRQLSDGGTNPQPAAVLDEWQRQTAFKQAPGTDAALPDYSTPWVYRAVGSTAGPVYRILVTGTRTIAGGALLYNPGDRWIRKMQPLRFTLYGAAVTTPLSQEFVSGSKLAYSNVSPPLDGHTKGATITALTFRCAMVIPGPFAETKLAYVSVRQNGSLVSGPTAVDGRFTTVTATNSRTCAMVLNIPVNTTVAADDVIDVDCWIYLSFTRAEVGSQFAPDTLNMFVNPWHMDAYANTVAPLAYKTYWTGINCNARVGRSDVFKVTWGSNAPGGTNPLTMQAQSGWAFTQVSRTSIMMTKTSAPSAGESVVFNWGREVPEIVANRLVSMPSGFAPRVRLVPVDSGHYNAGTPNFTEGVWYPASTNFKTASFLTTSGTPYAPAYVNMPSTCTLERV